MSDDVVDILKSAFALKEAERAAALLGETDPARIAAVAAQLRLSIGEDRALSVTGPAGESAGDLFAALGAAKAAGGSIRSVEDPESDPRLWSAAQKQDFIQKYGHESYRERFAAAIERKRQIASL